MRELFEITSVKNIRNDSIVKRSANAKVAKSTQIQNEIITSMTKLKEQNTLLSSLQQNVTKTTIRHWNLLIKCLPSNIFNFCRKALIFSLNNNSNLARWKIPNSPNCDLCGKTQTQIHALNNCIGEINDGRYKWRYDSILKTILWYIFSSNEYQVFADVEGYSSSAVFFASSIPDIVVINSDILYPVELTVCLETNFQKSRKYKMNRYKNMSNEVVGNYIVEKLFIEISTLGFYTNDMKLFIKFCKDLKINNTDRRLRKCSEVAMRTSFFLNIRKKKEWPSPKLLTFV